MTNSHRQSTENHSQSQGEPAPANLLRYGDETGHDPATRHAAALIETMRRYNQLRNADYARQLGVTP